MNKNRPTAPILAAALQQTFYKIQALRAYTQKTGFRTTRSEKELLAALGAEDLAAVLIALSCEHLHLHVEGLPCGDEQCPGCIKGGTVAKCKDCGIEDRRNAAGEGLATQIEEGQ